MMDAYKFQTKILADGVIRLPEMSAFADQDVEVFVMLQPEAYDKEKKQKAVETFLNTWVGILEEVDVDEAKFQYLKEKYE